MIPRKQALSVIGKVYSEHVHLDECLRDVTSAMSSFEKNWLWEVCSGTLRWKGRIDLILDQLCLKKKVSGWLRRALELAIYQILLQDGTQRSRVVNETVGLIKSKDGIAPSRFANAVLRKVCDQAESWINLPFPDTRRFQAQWTSLPEWLFEKMKAQGGLEWVQNFARSSLERPRLWLRSENPDEVPPSMTKGPIPGSFVWSSDEPFSGSTKAEQGKFYVQDISVQVLIHELSRVAREHFGENCRILDLCAAPGGKSIGLAWNGFDVTATDTSQKRMNLMEVNLKRLDLTRVKMLKTEDLKSPGDFDLVWVDPPCSGSGILRRHPDLKWNRKADELPKLLKLQAELLQQGMHQVRDGGLLMYSVCSVLKDEGVDLIRNLGFESAIIQKWNLAPQDPPHGDGFYGVLLKKIT